MTRRELALLAVSKFLYTVISLYLVILVQNYLNSQCHFTVQSHFPVILLQRVILLHNAIYCTETLSSLASSDAERRGSPPQHLTDAHLQQLVDKSRRTDH